MQLVATPLGHRLYKLSPKPKDFIELLDDLFVGNHHRPHLTHKRHGRFRLVSLEDQDSNGGRWASTQAHMAVDEEPIIFPHILHKVDDGPDVPRGWNHGLVVTSRHLFDVLNI